jgi:hypothetical protein
MSWRSSTKPRSGAAYQAMDYGAMMRLATSLLVPASKNRRPRTWCLLARFEKLKILLAGYHSKPKSLRTLAVCPPVLTQVRRSAAD